VVPDPGTEVYQFTGAMLIEPGTASPPANASTPGGVQSAADPVDLATGLLTGTHTDLAIADTLPISVTPVVSAERHRGTLRPGGCARRVRSGGL
jgi:hypothetical protein